MRPQLERVVSVVFDVVALAQETQLTFLAAAVAYYAFISLVPVMVLTLVVATTIGGEAFANDVVTLVGELLSPTGQSLLEGALTQEAGRQGATIVGSAILLWGVLKVFRAIDRAFVAVFEPLEERSLVDEVRDAFVVVVTMAFGLLLMAVATTLTAVLGDVLATVLSPLVLFATLAVAFFPLYYVLPDVPMTVRDALPGAVFAAGGWSILGVGFQIYAGLSASPTLYGVLGAVLLVISYLYFGSQIVLLGAALNAVLMKDRQVQTVGSRRSYEAMSEDEDHPESSGPSDDDTAGTDDERSPGADEVSTESAEEEVDEPYPAADEVSTESVESAPEVEELREEVARLRDELDEFEDDVTERTLHREEVESDLKRYVRRRIRRGHARGWGPYLVLLYGTVMTVAVAYAPYLGDGWTIFAMVVIWLSSLGLYVLMVLFGIGFSILDVPGRVIDAIADLRG